MDYPHPLVTLRPDGTLDYSKVYAAGMGEWDKVSIIYGYQDFPAGIDEEKALARILDEAWKKDLLYLSNQDIDAHPKVDQWSNGTDAAAELARMMEVRRVALSRFGENAIKLGEPLATMEEVLLPLYLHHRYQVEAAASVLGGQHYVYAMRGDGQVPFTRATAAEQQAALKALMETIAPSALALPASIVSRMPPRPDGYDMTRELFPRYTGMTFDVITPAVVAATHTFASIFQPERAARLVEQHAVDPSLPGLGEVIDRVGAALVQAEPAGPYEAEIARAVQRAAAEQLMGLAASAEMPQVRAIVTAKLEDARKSLLNTANANPDASTGAFATLLARDIGRFIENPDAFKRAVPIVVPPGAPIGEPGWDWLGADEPPCSLWDIAMGGMIRR
jgi:hypothetical protein